MIKNLPGILVMPGIFVIVNISTDNTVMEDKKEEIYGKIH